MNGLAGMEDLIVVLALVLALLAVLAILLALLRVVLDKLNAVLLQQTLDLVEFVLEFLCWILSVDDLELDDYVNQRVRGCWGQILGAFLIVIGKSEGRVGQ